LATILRFQDKILVVAEQCRKLRESFNAISETRSFLEQEVSVALCENALCNAGLQSCLATLFRFRRPALGFKRFEQSWYRS